MWRGSSAEKEAQEKAREPGRRGLIKAISQRLGLDSELGPRPTDSTVRVKQSILDRGSFHKGDPNL